MIGHDERMSSAGELADFLEDMAAGWVTSSDVYTNTGSASPGDLNYWRARAHAAVLWHDIDQYLDARERNGRNVDHFRVTLVPALRALFHPDQNWTQPSQRPDVSTAVAQLRGLDDLITDGSASAPVTEARRRDLRSLLDEVVDLLGDDDETYDEQERRYLLELVRSMTQLLDERTVLGEADLRDIVDRLVGALTALSINLLHAGRPSAARRVGAVLLRIASTARTVVADANALITLGSAVAAVINPGAAPEAPPQIES
jgi:hypothetical protein